MMKLMRAMEIAGEACPNPGFEHQLRTAVLLGRWTSNEDVLAAAVLAGNERHDPDMLCAQVGSWAASLVHELQDSVSIWDLTWEAKLVATCEAIDTLRGLPKHSEDHKLVDILEELFYAVAPAIPSSLQDEYALALYRQDRSIDYDRIGVRPDELQPVPAS